MRALQDNCVANEGVIRQFRKCQEIENKEKDQYKEAICTFNTKLTTKLTQSEKETCYHEELEKATTNLMTKLVALCEQMDKAKADTVLAFQISQPFFTSAASNMATGFMTVWNRLQPSTQIWTCPGFHKRYRPADS